MYRPVNESPKIAALYKAGPSKSFTASTTAMAQLGLAPESSSSTVGAGPLSPEEVEYISIAQFQNKVELYRGRYGQTLLHHQSDSASQYTAYI